MAGVSEKGSARRLAVFALQEREVDGQKKTFWPRMGRAFVNHDGSITLVLDGFPIGTNKLQVREDDRADARPGAGAGNGARRNGHDTAETEA